MSITIRRISYTEPRIIKNKQYYQKLRFEARGMMTAKSFVLCPSCKVMRRTSRDIFECCNSTFKTIDHLTDPKLYPSHNKTIFWNGKPKVYLKD